MTSKLPGRRDIGRPEAGEVLLHREMYGPTNKRYYERIELGLYLEGTKYVWSSNIH